MRYIETEQFNAQVETKVTVNAVDLARYTFMAGLADPRDPEDYQAFLRLEQAAADAIPCPGEGREWEPGVCIGLCPVCGMSTNMAPAYSNVPVKASPWRVPRHWDRRLLGPDYWARYDELYRLRYESLSLDEARQQLTRLRMRRANASRLLKAAQANGSWEGSWKGRSLRIAARASRFVITGQEAT